jgi:hypothetical protein
MRRLCLLALLAAPAFPSACTLSASYTLSASSGHWTGGCPTIPGNGDTVTIAEGVTLNVNQNWTIGASGANNTTPAIYDGVTGLVKVNAGVALTLRGDFLWTRGSPYYNSGLTMDAGSALVFDASQASSPTTTRYRIGDNESIYGSRWLAANGTSASHVAITSVNTNGALNGQFRSGLNAVGAAAGYGGCDLQVAYADFSNIGDMATYGEAFAPREYPTDPGTCTVTNSTFNNVGPWLNANLDFSSNETVNIGNNVWTNSPCASATYGCFPVTNEAPSAGSYLFQNNVFDFCIGLEYNQYAMRYDGSYLGKGACVGGLSSLLNQTGLFLYNPLNTVFNSTLSYTYWFLDGLAVTNDPHWTSYGPQTNIGIVNSVFEMVEDVSANTGQAYIGNQSGGAYTQTLANNILLPSKTGKATTALVYNGAGCTSCANLTANLNHDTLVGTAANGLSAMATVDEDGAATWSVNQEESDLVWSNAGSYYKIQSWQTTSPNLRLQPVATADYNFADGHRLLSNASCTGCSNQGNGYAANWSTTPGSHDVDALYPTVTNPYLADTTRNLASWDTAYLGQPLGTQWSSSLGAIAYGGIVSESHSGYYGGAAHNFRCLYPTGCVTSAANSEPMVGSSWTTYWEWASLYDLRKAVAAGSTYTDGAIGCASGCSAVQALVGWVQKGYTPQAPALWCAGHDGETVGAVPFCANGKVLLGTLAGM